MKMGMKPSKVTWAKVAKKKLQEIDNMPIIFPHQTTP